jgi:Ca2+-binding RTX toxin-like protein
VTALAAAAPSQAAETGVALVDGAPSTLVTFNVENPAAAPAPVGITFPAGATDTDLVGIDYRPRGGQLYGQATGGTLYVLNPPAMAGGNFTATRVNPTPGMDPNGTAAEYGFDFNPIPDAIRVVNDADDNFRFSPVNGSLIAQDGDLAYAAGDVNNGEDPNIVAAGYTNSFDGNAAPPAGVGTTLFDIDSNLDILATQIPPNDGTLNTVGELGVDTTGDAGFDIAQASGTAFAALTPAVPGTSSLYTVNLGSGAATLVGAIDTAQVIEGIAIAPASRLRFGATSYVVSEGGDSVTVTVTREGPANRAATVDYTTDPGSAGSGDFGSTSGTLTFAPGDFSESFTVPITDDSADESDEAFSVTLANAGDNAILASPTTATVTIADDDATPSQGGGGGGTGGGAGGPINGTDGNDRITGTSGNDVINCGDGNDIVNGGGGDDVINCGAGNDVVNGDAGNDRIDGSSGNDTLNGGTGDDTIQGGTGNDRISGNSGADTLSGGSGNDVLSGNEGDDRLFGNEGNDRISGNEGDDRGSGGAGDDRLSGNSGNDRLSGNSGRDRISGNSGNDRLSGNSGRDRLSGGTGQDALSGGSGRDVVRQS